MRSILNNGEKEEKKHHNSPVFVDLSDLFNFSWNDPPPWLQLRNFDYEHLLWLPPKNLFKCVSRLENLILYYLNFWSCLMHRTRWRNSWRRLFHGDDVCVCTLRVASVDCSSSGRSLCRSEEPPAPVVCPAVVVFELISAYIVPAFDYLCLLVPILCLVAVDPHPFPHWE